MKCLNNVKCHSNGKKAFEWISFESLFLNLLHKFQRNQIATKTPRDFLKKLKRELQEWKRWKKKKNSKEEEENKKYHAASCNLHAAEPDMVWLKIIEVIKK